MALIQSTGKFATACNTFGEYELKLFEIRLTKSLSVVRIVIVGIDISKVPSKQVSDPIELKLMELQLTYTAYKHISQNCGRNLFVFQKIKAT